LAAFSQFASDLDAETKQRIARGKLLTEILKQKQYSPLSVAEQVIMLLAATKGAFDGLAVDKVAEATRELLAKVGRERADLVAKLNEGSKPDDDTVNAVVELAAGVAKSFVQVEGA
jgi:F-type H+-transporting ATPase subunit alpha